VDAELLGDPDPAGRLPGNANLAFPGCDGDSLLYLLDAQGIEVSTGSACSAGVPQPSHVLTAMGVPERLSRGALRLTLGRTTGPADVDAVLAALPAAVSGINDWADTTPASDGVRRIGAVHAVANVAALGLYAASYAARRRDDHARGVALGLAGVGALAVGGQLGGHLSYSRAVGVDNTAFESGPEEWTDVLDDAALAEGALARAEVDGQAIVLARVRGQVHALADRCAHRGGSLSEGELAGDCVECPLHGSRYRLFDGSVERGPSAYPQPVYEVRIANGRIAVRA
jgi:nitrite reductase/ring-hydroxylating ferredoxin subunit